MIYLLQQPSRLWLNNYNRCHGNADKGFSVLRFTFLAIKPYLLHLAKSCHGLQHFFLHCAQVSMIIATREVCQFGEEDSRITKNGEQIRMCHRTIVAHFTDLLLERFKKIRKSSGRIDPGRKIVLSSSPREDGSCSSEIKYDRRMALRTQSFVSPGCYKINGNNHENLSWVRVLVKFPVARRLSRIQGQHEAFLDFPCSNTAHC